MDIQDARGRRLTFTDPPQRIVSLVPSTTETLHALGCADRVVGVTRFCCHPKAWTRTVPKIGGTKDVDVDSVLALDPDLVVGNCEENTSEIFDALEPHVPVWAALPKTVGQAIQDLLDLGHLVHSAHAAQTLAATIQDTLENLQQTARDQGEFTAAYLIWRDPWMTISNDTFIADMIATAGGTNVFGSHPDRFPVISADDIARAEPDLLLLSSEPFPFRHRHRTELAEATGMPLDRIRFIDGEQASWHGVRMAAGLEYLRHCRLEGWPTGPK